VSHIANALEQPPDRLLCLLCSLQRDHASSIDRPPAGQTHVCAAPSTPGDRVCVVCP
jgi:hypothetical protein